MATSRFAVVGVTSWGVTLAWLLRKTGHEVTLIARTPEEASAAAVLRGVARLPEITLDPAVSFAHPAEMPSNLDGFVAVVPAQAIRGTFAHAGFDRSVPILCAAKGIELSSGGLLSSVFEELGWDAANIAAISGPNLAHEIAQGMPAAAVIAARDEALAMRWQDALSSPSFRVYRTGDITGVELAGALKNVVAIAVGAGFGLGFGANLAAAIVTRGLAEMTRLGIPLGAQPLTFQGLAGVGDLTATCFSPLSRNRRLGELLARGSTLAEAHAAIGEVVEGAATAPVAAKLAARLGVSAPIIDCVADALDGRLTVQEAMALLLSRQPKPEEFARF